jgi:hypothetical protein
MILKRGVSRMASKKQETVVVQDYPNKMGYVQAQPHTHFRLKQKSDRKKLLQIIDSISDASGPIVASYDYGRKYNTDIIIRRRGDTKAEPIGKIHLLLFDKPNRYDHDKYYIKLHFFQFINDDLFDKVKERVSSFFQSLPPTSEPYLGNSTRRNENSANQRNHSRKTIKNSLTLNKMKAMKIDEPTYEMK